jgi:hypothetical protein
MKIAPREMTGRRRTGSGSNNIPSGVSSQLRVQQQSVDDGLLPLRGVGVTGRAAVPITRPRVGSAAASLAGERVGAFSAHGSSSARGCSPVDDSRSAAAAATAPSGLSLSSAPPSGPVPHRPLTELCVSNCRISKEDCCFWRPVSSSATRFILTAVNLCHQLVEASTRCRTGGTGETERR